MIENNYSRIALSHAERQTSIIFLCSLRELNKSLSSRGYIESA
ncbi:hypothetical protein [Methanosarcina sp. UBA289]|nr:hypothetical protein [Methanosarcina sp. UBA289]